MHLSRTGRRRVAAAPAVVALAATLLTGAATPAFGVPKPIPVPTASKAPKVTQGQVTVAAAAKAALATKVGQLSGQIAQAQAALQQLEARKELAEQKVALAISELRKAQGQAAQARARELAAATAVTVAHAKFVEYVQAVYIGGDLGGTAGTLLTAKDPTQLLDHSALEQYQAQTKVDAIGGLQRATVVRSNAEAAARRAVRKTAQLKAAADAARRAAARAVAQAQAQAVALRQTLTEKQNELDRAQLQYVQLYNDRAAYQKYLAYRAYQAAQAQYQRYLAAKAAQARRAAIALANARARAARAQQHQGGGGGGGGSVSIASGPSAPTGGTWTAAKGRRAVARARSTLGIPYAWAGGSASGPSYGVCDAGNGAPNDCNVLGYDCSGLVMYAWGRNWDHYAATQYSQAGRYHPSPSNFKPGDLLFWSSDGTRGGIEHVAIYSGDGNVIQAPQSNDVIRVTPWNQVMWGYYGATRPLT